MEKILQHSIIERNNIVSLIYDCLCPPQHEKILDVLLDDSLCEMLVWYDVELTYSVTGYKFKKIKERIWSRDLIIVVKSQDYLIDDLPLKEREKELKSIRKDLEKLAEIVKEKTGIE